MASFQQINMLLAVFSLAYGQSDQFTHRRNQSLLRVKQIPFAVCLEIDIPTLFEEDALIDPTLDRCRNYWRKRTPSLNPSIPPSTLPSPSTNSSTKAAATDLPTESPTIFPMEILLPSNVATATPTEHLSQSPSNGINKFPSISPTWKSSTAPSYCK